MPEVYCRYAIVSGPIAGAFQPSAWLVEETARALQNQGDLDAALERYRRAFRRRLGLHHWVIAEYATGRKTFGVERAFFRATAKDPTSARNT